MRMVLDHPHPTGTMGATPGGFKNMKRPRVVSATGGMEPTYMEVSTCPTIRPNPRNRQ